MSYWKQQPLSNAHSNTSEGTLRGHCIEVAAGVKSLPFDEVCQALDELAQGGQINVVGFRSSIRSARLLPYEAPLTSGNPKAWASHLDQKMGMRFHSIECAEQHRHEMASLKKCILEAR